MKRTLVELNQNVHGDLKVVPNAALIQAAKQHIIGVKVNELGQVLSDMPIFFTRVDLAPDDPHAWSLSAITGLHPGTNLFVVDEQWDGVYLPSALRTFPLYLMPATGEQAGYSVGIEPESPMFSRTEGTALFDNDGNASEYLSQLTVQLDADIKHEVLTYRFVKQLSELKLLREIDVVVTFDDHKLHTLKGLHTINEDKFREFSDETILALQENGHMASIYAMLFSIYQLHGLVKRHNLKPDTQKIIDIKVAVTSSE